MENENIDAPEVIETQEPGEETVETPEETAEDKISRLEAEKAELEDKNKKLYARVKKEPKVEEKKIETEGLTQKDLLFLAKSDIHEDNLDEVLEWAKFKKVSVADAYKQLKPKLDIEAEQRKTAEATNTKGGARGGAKVSGEEILAQADKTGTIPETTEGMQAHFFARLNRTLKK